MIRVSVICVLVLLSGCAGTTKLERDLAHYKALTGELSHRMRQLQQQQDALVADNAALGTGDRPLAGYTERTLVAFVENRPPQCTGGLCLRIVNDRPNPLTNITINGEAVLVRPRPEHGSYLWPHEEAFIRLIRPGAYNVTAQTVDAIGLPNGRAIPVPNVQIEHCAWSGTIPTAGDIRLGRTDLRFGSVRCEP